MCPFSGFSVKQMQMKKNYLNLLSGTVLGTVFFLMSCHSAYEVTKVEGERVAIDSS